MEVTFRTSNGLVWTREVPGPGLDQRTFDARVESGDYVVLDQAAEAVAGDGGGSDDAELDALRVEYESVVGEAPDRRWKAARLRKEIEAAQDDEGD